MRICVKLYKVVQREEETGVERAGQGREETEGRRHKLKDKVIWRSMTKNTLKDKGEGDKEGTTMHGRNQVIQACDI